MTDNSYDDEGWRYGVRFGDGSIRNIWNGHTQRQRALEDLVRLNQQFPGDASRMAVVRRRDLGDWQVAELGFVCPLCAAESWHPKDKEYGYCGRCHDYTGAPGTVGDMVRQAVIDRRLGCSCRRLAVDPENLTGHHRECPLHQVAAADRRAILLDQADGTKLYCADMEITPGDKPGEYVMLPKAEVKAIAPDGTEFILFRPFPAYPIIPTYKES